ncbi:MAG: ASCH domain-containing protein, partial [Patescibacteria group bacterium]
MDIKISNQWSFGEDKSFSDRMIGLVISGVKTATTGLYDSSESNPCVGCFDEIVDYDGKPVCV